MRASFGLLIVIALSGCCHDTVITKPTPITVETIRLQAVHDALTEPHPVAEGPLSLCPWVASDRKRELEACNADKAAIRSQHGGGQ